MKKVMAFFKLTVFLTGLLFISVQVLAVTHTITITSSSTFTPSTLTINSGDLVEFEVGAGANGGIHPVVADNGEWATITLGSPGDKSSTITLSVGTHGYHCGNHGGVGTGMHGTIIVLAPAGIRGAQTSAYGLTIAPNPFEDEVTLNVDQSHTELAKIKIMDLIGNEVAVIDLSNKNLSNYRVDFSHLKPGVYFCNLYSDKGILETRKLFRTK